LSECPVSVPETKKLVHMQSMLDDMWFWLCPICGEQLAPHQAGRGKGDQVLQSKGVASKHLARHDPSLVYHGRDINDISSLNNNVFLTRDQVVELFKIGHIKINSTKLLNTKGVVRIKGFKNRICVVSTTLDPKTYEAGTYNTDNYIYTIKKESAHKWWHITGKIPKTVPKIAKL